MKIEESIKIIQEEINSIKARNKRVEANKAWEISKTRAVFIACITYLLILLFMILIKEQHPFVNAFIAATGYLISTFSYDILKKWWLRRNH